MKPKTWGNWKLNMSKPVSLDFDNKYYSVQIPLDRVRTKKELDEWVGYLNEKYHVWTYDVDDFLKAVKEMNGQIAA